MKSHPGLFVVSAQHPTITPCAQPSTAMPCCASAATAARPPCGRSSCSSTSSSSWPSRSLRHICSTHLTWRGAAETLVLLLVVWRGWIHITWLTNYFDVRQRPVRLFVLAMMVASLISSASIPEAFDERGIAFAAGFAAIYLGGCAFGLFVVGRQHHLTPAFERVTIWGCVIVPLYLIGGVVEGDARLVIWAATVALIYVVMWLGFPTPRLGHSHTTDYTIAGEHMAERCLLFITLALGESIIITGSEFGELPASIERCAAFIIAFIGSVAIWWIYFDRAAEAGSQVISEAEDPGRLGLVAYTYIHIPMVAGVIVAAAGDEIAIAHPLDEVTFRRGGADPWRPGAVPGW